MTLFIVGLLMNIVGVFLGSSRDLKWFFKSLPGTLETWLSRFFQHLRRQWSRIWSRKKKAEGHAVVGAGSSLSGAAGRVSTWDPVPDGIDLPTAIERLRSRTDTLQQMLRAEEANRAADVAKLFDRLDGLTKDLQAETARLNEKIDDFDVKPAGQRAIGALLVICGTFLMAITALPGMVAQ